MITKNVLWIASYPKSGNTWIHSVLRRAGNGYGFPQRELDVYNIASVGRELVHCDAVADRFCTQQPCMVLKTHAVFRADRPLHDLSGIQLLNAGFIHIYRNPLDVLLSYLNFTRIEYKARSNDAAYKKMLFVDLLGFPAAHDYESWRNMTLDTLPRANLDHALTRFSESDMMIAPLGGMSGSWLTNTRAWLQASKTLPGLSVRYEDCLTDPQAVAKLADFFIFSRQEVLSALEVVNASSRMQAGAGGSPDQTIFFNKMEAYYFDRYFSRAVIDGFLTRHEAALRELGYSSLLQSSRSPISTGLPGEVSYSK